MYYVFLDTNLFVSNFQFNSKENSTLLKYSKRGDIKLCLTYTNYREIIKKYKDTISPIIKNMKSANAEYLKHSGSLIIKEIKKPKEYAQQYKSYLDNLIAQNNMDVIRHNTDFSTKIVDKYFNNEKPFDINKPSFQDAIIWETICDFYNSVFIEDEDKIFFLTRNIKDFAKERTSENGIKYDLFENLYGEVPELLIYNDAQEFLANEEGELHDYLREYFDFNEEDLQKVIERYVSNSMEIDFEIENFLSQREFDAEYFSGWGEDADSKLDDIIIIDSSKDIETGYIELNCNLEYDVNFTISTKNPIFEADNLDDVEYFKDESGEVRIQVSLFIKMINNEIEYFSIDEIQII